MPKKRKFKIENDIYEWDEQFITGAEVRTVGPGIPEGMDLFVKVPGSPGRLIENDESVDLDAEPGIENFILKSQARKQEQHNATIAAFRLRISTESWSRIRRE